MPSGPVRVLQKSSLPPAPPPGTLAALRTPQDLGFEGVVARAATVEEESYFDVLGVVDGASGEAVRAAFMRLAKSWHPDRLDVAYHPLRDEIAKIFARMTRAQQTLCDADARRAYVASRREATKTRPRADVMREIEHGQDQRDAEYVVRRCQELIDADADDAEALAIQAWATAQWGETGDDELRAALTKMDRAVNVDRTNAQAVYHRGLVQKRLNNVPAAFRDFARAVQLDPKHIGAEREVRIFAMRARKGGADEHKLIKPR